VSSPLSRPEVTRRTEGVRAWLANQLVETPDGGPTVVVGLGIGHVLVAAWNFRREIRELSVETGPVLAALLIALFGLFVCLVGAWLWRSPFRPGDRWLVGAGSVAGALVVGSVIYISVLIRLSEGRTVAEPLFVLSLASSQGTLAGSVGSVLYARARREAAAARRRRDQIELVTGILRHDVKNSMTVIRSRAELLERGETDRQREFADTIVGRSQKVIDLAERIEDVVSVMASDESLERKPVALAPVVADQVAAVRPPSDDVTVETDVDDVEVFADDLLPEVVGNLLENAFDHAVGEAGTVSVTTVTADDRVQLRVADTGDGIADDRKATVFERGTSTGDSGFGLFFVATVVDHYGGDVWVEDREDDRSGAVFVVELDRV